MAIWFEEQCHAQDTAWPFRGPPHSCSVSFSVLTQFFTRSQNKIYMQMQSITFRTDLAERWENIHKNLHFRVLYKSSLLPPSSNLSYKLSPEFGAHWKRQPGHRKRFRDRILLLTHVSRPLWLFTKLLTNQWVFFLRKILLWEFGGGWGMKYLKYLSCHLIPCPISCLWSWLLFILHCGILR